MDKKNLSVAIIDEFYTFDLMETHNVYRICRKIDLELEIQSKKIFFEVYSIYHKWKTFPRNLIVLLKNGKKVP